MNNSTHSLSRDVPPAAHLPGGLSDSGLVWTLFRFAWRNLWRNKRRTWLTVGGIAFAVWFLIFARSMQGGTFDLMIDNTARVMTGHVQIQHPNYDDDPRINFVFDATLIRPELADRPGVKHVSERVQGYALISVGEHSVGGQVLGVEPEIEGQWSAIAAAVEQGRYLRQPGEIVVGDLLARNLGVKIGDELLLLGTAVEGGVAAHAAQIVGIFSTASAAMNRGLVQIHIDDFRAAWALGQRDTHALVAIATSVVAGEQVATELAQNAVVKHAGLRTFDWRQLMPETDQMRDMKIVGTDVFFVVLSIIVGFSVVNTFMMMVFERTKEFGLMMAIGMRPHQLQIQLHVEAFYLTLLGLSLGVALAVLIILAVSEQGIPIPVDQAQELLRQFNMSDRVYPKFDWTALEISTLLMLFGVQLAALLPCLRLYRLRPVDAMRQET